MIKGVFLFILICNLASIYSQNNNLEDVSNYDTNIIIDLKYASTDNFMSEKVYDCEVCLLQPMVLKSLIEANVYFNKIGYRIKVFDCYRPLSIQQKMWKKLPNAAYVANPNKGGSIHNKGAAIDLTIVKLDGTPVNMGTPFDYFGKKAHLDNSNLPTDVIENRKFLFDIMKTYGFQPIRTEWWHFSYKKNLSFPTLNDPLPCKN